MERVIADKETAQSSDVKELWQSRWDAAGDAERAQISKAWEYYVYCLMYRGHTMGGVPVVEMMLDHAQYARFHPAAAQPPSYWMEYARTLGVMPEDIMNFQRLGQQRIH